MSAVCEQRACACACACSEARSDAIDSDDMLHTQPDGRRDGQRQRRRHCRWNDGCFGRSLVGMRAWAADNSTSVSACARQPSTVQSPSTQHFAAVFDFFILVFCLLLCGVCPHPLYIDLLFVPSLQIKALIERNKVNRNKMK